MYKTLNAVGYQAGWWACIASVSLGLELEAILFCLCLTCIHLRLSASPLQEIKIGVIALLLGILVDSLLQTFAFIHFYGWALGPLSPFWLWALWVLFAMTLHTSLAFLKRLSPIVISLLGFIFGPLTYYAGAKLGAAELETTHAHLFALAAAWAIALPLLMWAANQTSAHPATNA